MSEALNVIDLMQKAQELAGNYENVVLAVTDDHVIRMARMTEPYFWHFHPNSDETFVGLEGTVVLECEEGCVELQRGQMFTVPRGMKHRTSPLGASSVNLTIERADMETIRVDEGANS